MSPTQSRSIPARFPVSRGIALGLFFLAAGALSASTPCAVPAAPSLKAPASASAGQSYVLSWSNVISGSDFVLDEATKSDFSDAVSIVRGANSFANSATFAHSVCANTTYYYRLRARNATNGCATDGPESSVAAVNIQAPAAPGAAVLSGPARAESGAAYALNWSGLTSASGAVLEESLDSSFANASPRLIASDTNASFNHFVCTDTRFYYRLRGENGALGCNVTGPNSDVVSVLITPGPVSDRRVLAVVGSLHGSGGAIYKTSIQLSNRSTAPETGSLIIHPAGIAATASDPAFPYSLAAGETEFIDDLLPQVHLTGLASADVVPASGEFPSAVTRIFQDGGAAGTAGFIVPLVDPAEALRLGDQSVLVLPPDASTPFNVGIRSLGSGFSATLTVRDASGNVVGSSSKSYPANYFAQVSAKDFLGGAARTPNTSVELSVESGSAVIYGVAVDPVTHDTSAQFADRLF